MKTYNNHPQWYNVPLRLNKQERHNPHIVLNEFFESYHLNEVREQLWNWLVEVLSSSQGISSNSHDRNNHIYFYEKLEELVEAAYIMHKENIKKSKKLKVVHMNL